MWMQKKKKKGLGMSQNDTKIPGLNHQKRRFALLRCQRFREAGFEDKLAIWHQKKIQTPRLLLRGIQGSLYNLLKKL